MQSCLFCPQGLLCGLSLDCVKQTFHGRRRGGQKHRIVSVEEFIDFGLTWSANFDHCLLLLIQGIFNFSHYHCHQLNLSNNYGDRGHPNPQPPQPSTTQKPPQPPFPLSQTPCLDNLSSRQQVKVSVYINLDLNTITKLNHNIKNSFYNFHLKSNF